MKKRLILILVIVSVLAGGTALMINILASQEPEVVQENLQALSSGEWYLLEECIFENTTSSEFAWANICDSETSHVMRYPCDFQYKSVRDEKEKCYHK